MTDLEAANRALVLIGVAPIGALSDASQPARTMRRMLDGTKRVVLSEFPWSFAHRAASLSPTADVPPPGFLHVFVYPSDAVNIDRVTDGLRTLVPFQTLEGGRIAANVERGHVEYTAWIPDLGAWRGDVAECFVTRLASDAAATLTGSQQLAMALLEKYYRLVREAQQAGVVEEYSPFDLAVDYIAVR